MARLKADDLIVERVDPADTTKILVAERLGSRDFIVRHSSKTYTFIFDFTSDVLLRPGLNKVSKVRIRYEGLPGVIDWLEYTNAAQEWVSITNVKFNGKPIPRIDSSEPVERSYLYVLQ